MPSKDTMHQARYIFTSTKLIRDRILRNITGHSAMNGKNGPFGDLSLAQIHVVNVTKDRGKVTITKLADMLGVSPPSASVMVDRLVEKGILIRNHSKKDRRKVVVRVAEDAVNTFEKIEENILESFVRLVEGIGPETAGKWCEVLERVREVQEQGI
jgi:DNA-binding MarR family transcriptional regulator